MKIIYTFGRARATPPVITAAGNESGGAGNFRVSRA